MPAEKQNNRPWGLLASDLAAGSISACLVSPVVAIIDRATVEKSLSNRPLLRTLGRHSLCSLRYPRRFLVAKPFFVVWSLYAITFSVANTSETIAAEWAKLADKTAIDLVSFISTFLVNVPLGVWKDLRFAQFYGVVNPTKTMTTMPKARVDIRLPSTPTKYSVIAATMAFLLRDAITIFGSFKLAPWFAEHFKPDSVPTNPHTSYMVSQLVVPAMTQFFATPLHILGMDLYRQPRGVTFFERVARVGRDTPSITLVRSCRILPAFGAGVLCNTELRNSFRGMAQPM